MLSNTVIALVIGVGAGGWAYAKASRTTGGNAKSGLAVGAAVGLLVFVVVLVVASMFNK